MDWLASSTSSPPVPDTSRLDQIRKFCRSSGGTPSSQQITVNGTGKATAAIRSQGDRAGAASSNWSTSSSTRGRRAAVRRLVNALPTSPRNRV
jgi:hypothetical protein